MKEPKKKKFDTMRNLDYNYKMPLYTHAIHAHFPVLLKILSYILLSVITTAILKQIAHLQHVTIMCEFSRENKYLQIEGKKKIKYILVFLKCDFVNVELKYNWGKKEEGHRQSQ